MKEVKKSGLRIATEEIIEKIGLTTPNEQGEKVPIVFDDNVSDQEVEQVFKDAVSYIDPVLDKNKGFSLATKIIIHNSNPELFPEVDEKIKEATKKEVVTEPEAESADDLFTQINRCERLKDLKEIAQANAEFKGLRGRLNSYKSLDDLHDAMIDVLNSEPAYVVAERLHEQNIEKQPVNAGKKFESKMEVVPAGNKKEATLIPDKKEKKAPVKTPAAAKTVYSRVDSICDAIKNFKGFKDKEQLATKANELYIAKGGTDNIKESKSIMKYVLPALAAFDIEVPS
jgi:hypothetical protein